MANKNVAPVSKRVVAAIIDGVLLGIVMTVVNMLLGLHVPMGPTSYMSGGLNGVYTAFLISGLIASAVGIGYFAYFEGGEKQASVGKSLLGLKVVKVDGGKLDQKLAAKRAAIVYACYVISLLLPLSLGILKTIVNLGGLYVVGLVLFNEERQGFHDKVCRTYVVQA